MLWLVLVIFLNITTDEGNGLDPHGGTRLNADNGCGIDPNGGCRGGALSDQGSGIDPNGLRAEWMD